MKTRTYKINDFIENEAGLTLLVQEIDSPSDKTIGEADSCYKTVCECGYILEKVAENLEKQKTCTRCLVKAAVLGFDADGEITSINGYGMLEYTGYLTATHDISEHEAFDVLVEMVKANRLVV